ncbi:hypothetical protein B0H14DRAFT_3000041 [Mycena olivaceomarginata]|nr:hypothetical protein B0H14DRAFT_3000041 [Mycena olivaceomarginata]
MYVFVSPHGTHMLTRAQISDGHIELGAANFGSTDAIVTAADSTHSSARPPASPAPLLVATATRSLSASLHTNQGALVQLLWLFVYASSVGEQYISQRFALASSLLLPALLVLPIVIGRGIRSYQKPQTRPHPRGHTSPLARPGRCPYRALPPPPAPGCGAACARVRVAPRCPSGIHELQLCRHWHRLRVCGAAYGAAVA